MSPVTHFLLGWMVANTTDLGRKERATVTAASVIPDIDGAGFIAEYLTRGSLQPLLWYSTYHHKFGHNLPFGLLVALGAFALSGRRWRTATLGLIRFHLHLLERSGGLTRT